MNLSLIAWNERLLWYQSSTNGGSENPFDMEKGVRIVESLVKEGATSEDLRKRLKLLSTV